MHEYYTHIPKLIIPIPLHKKRLQERGFNQALEVAKVIASTLQIAIEKHSIIRKKPTKPQAQLNALERKRNINNAFELKKPIQHDHIILFDDVITTGGTISECSRIIANSHIKQIDAWCIARAGD
jgi:ComF family protein